MKDETAITFGQVVKRLRMARQLSQEDLAHRANRERTTIGKIETNAEVPNVRTIIAISIALRMKPSEFMKAVEEYNNKALNKLIELQKENFDDEEK